MNLVEKIFAIVAIIATFTILFCLYRFPELRYLKPLLLICAGGFVVNVGLISIILRDIFLRPFPSNRQRYFWIAMVLVFWPTIFYYLARYAFKPRHVVAAR